MNRLHLWRIRAGLTQAEAANKIGIGLSTYGLLESGRLAPSLMQQQRLFEAFGPAAQTLLDPVKEEIEVAR